MTKELTSGFSTLYIALKSPDNCSHMIHPQQILLDKDFLDFFKVLNFHKVQYLVVGGYAMAAYGHPRPTGDLDLFTSSETANVTSLQKAVKHFGFGETGLNVSDFLTKRLIVQLDLKTTRIDIMNYIDGITFETSWPNRTTLLCTDVPVHFVGKDDLILNKKAGGRTKDLADLENLAKKF